MFALVLHFDDLVEQDIVRTWTTLNKYIDERGFPPGRMIGKKRTWTPVEVTAWIEAQPTHKLEPRGRARLISENHEAGMEQAKLMRAAKRAELA